MFVTYLFQFSLQLITKAGFTILKGIANRIHTIQLSVVMLVPLTREIKLSILKYNFQLQGLSTNSFFFTEHSASQRPQATFKELQKSLSK